MYGMYESLVNTPVTSCADSKYTESLMDQSAVQYFS